MIPKEHESTSSDHPLQIRDMSGLRGWALRAEQPAGFKAGQAGMAAMPTSNTMVKRRRAKEAAHNMF